MDAKILARTPPPPRPFTHWTTRRLGTTLGINHMTLQRVWQRAELASLRFAHSVASPDPDFEQKAADAIGF